MCVGNIETIDMTSSHLMQGDCLKVMQLIPDNSVDCIITDPPYNLGQFMHKRNTNLVKMRENQFAYAGWDNYNYEEWKESMKAFLKECKRILKKKGTLIVFMAIIKISDIIELAEEYGFYYKTTGIWHKKNPMPRNMKIQFVNSTECWIYFINDGTSGTFNNNGRVKHDFLESAVCPISEKKHGKHPTQKPISIMKELIEAVTNLGDMVLDPFMGSGSTCVAAALTGRKYLGIELNKEYYKIAKLRIDDIKGK